MLYQCPPSSVRFEHLTPDDGLSQSVFGAIAQDSLGFLWFGETHLALRHLQQSLQESNRWLSGLKGAGAPSVLLQGSGRGTELAGGLAQETQHAHPAL